MRQLRITKSITNRETPSLDKYLQDISKEELVSVAQEVELAQRIKQGDKIALEKLIRANLRFVVSVAKQYQNQGLSLPDLINEGNLGLIKAAQRFDETRGFKFISYAVWWIRQSILLAISDQSKIIRLPHNQLTNLNNLKKVINKFETQFERVPNDEELENLMGMKSSKIETIRQNMVKFVSTDEPTDSENPGTTFMDNYQDPEAETDRDINTEFMKKEIQKSLSKISQKEEDIVKLYYGIGVDYPMSLEEIAHKFAMTRERVRQIKEKALKRLRYNKENKHLKYYL